MKTPRTDAQPIIAGNKFVGVPIEFARQLESELGEAIEALAGAAGYLASVRTDRRYREPGGAIYCGQTRDWADGAKQFAEKANQLLEKFDNAHRPTS